MFSMVLVGSGSVSFDTDPDSGSTHFLIRIRIRIQGNETDSMDPDPDPEHCGCATLIVLEQAINTFFAKYTALASSLAINLSLKNRLVACCVPVYLYRFTAHFLRPFIFSYIIGAVSPEIQY